MRSERLATAAAVAAPFLLIVCVRTITGLSPSASSAAPPDTRPSQAAPPIRIDPDVAAWLESLEIGPQLRSPLDHPDPDSNSTITDDRDPLTGMRLSSVIGSGGGGVAVINGELLRLGDAPAPGCEVVEIDARAQLVRIRLPDGRVRELVRER